jgi:hypothetical protein
VPDWQRHSPYAITNGRHWIAKLLVNGVPGYLVWLDGRLTGPCFATAAEAKAWAQQHEAPPVT